MVVDLGIRYVVVHLSIRGRQIPSIVQERLQTISSRTNPDLEGSKIVRAQTRLVRKCIRELSELGEMQRGRNQIDNNQQGSTEKSRNNCCKIR